MKSLASLVLLSALTLPGCAYIGPHSDFVAQKQYDTYAPQHSSAQKAAMGTDEMLAEYNKHVRPPDRLVCRRQKTVGTHFQKAVCRTATETTDERVAARDFVRSQRQDVIRLPSPVQTPDHPYRWIDSDRKPEAHP